MKKIQINVIYPSVSGVFSFYISHIHMTLENNTKDRLHKFHNLILFQIHKFHLLVWVYSLEDKFYVWWLVYVYTLVDMKRDWWLNIYLGAPLLVSFYIFHSHKALSHGTIDLHHILHNFVSCLIHKFHPPLLVYLLWIQFTKNIHCIFRYSLPSSLTSIHDKL